MGALAAILTFICFFVCLRTPGSVSSEQLWGPKKVCMCALSCSCWNTHSLTPSLLRSFTHTPSRTRHPSLCGVRFRFSESRGIDGGRGITACHAGIPCRAEAAQPRLQTKPTTAAATTTATTTTGTGTGTEGWRLCHVLIPLSSFLPFTPPHPRTGAPIACADLACFLPPSPLKPKRMCCSFAMYKSAFQKGPQVA